jgi:hypothetical protein
MSPLHIYCAGRATNYIQESYPCISSTAEITKLQILRLNFNQITPFSTDIPEKVIVAQLVNKFPAFYATREFITVLKRARNWTISSPR